MYSEEHWGGTVPPFIMTVFENYTAEIDHDPIVSFVMFEWMDQDLLGKDDGSGIGLVSSSCKALAALAAC